MSNDRNGQTESARSKRPDRNGQTEKSCIPPVSEYWNAVDDNLMHFTATLRMISAML